MCETISPNMLNNDFAVAAILAQKWLDSPQHFGSGHLTGKSAEEDNPILRRSFEKVEVPWIPLMANTG